MVGPCELLTLSIEEHRVAALAPVPEPTTITPAQPMAISPADQTAITPAEAKEVVDELLQKLDTGLLGIKTLSKFYTDNREMLRKHVNIATITNAGQLGDHIQELLTRSHGFICEGLEKRLTDADLRPSEFNYGKWFEVDADEDLLTRLINKLNADFRSSVKLEKSPLQLSMSMGKEAFQEALDAQHAQTDGVPLPSSPI
jgi:nucleotidyltransferase/DNA polymerase involved in DNA repair